ncbi:MAG: hypothetical protein P8J87_09100, partial [Verrucomicrobiales bacterium]|nr:hypothetical protein [Verrucomicrobiales bacterium]
RDAGANITDLSPYFDTSKYLTPSSDILALMLIEHQTGMHNRLNRASYAIRQAMHRQHSLQKLFAEPHSDVPKGSALSVLQSQAEKILKYLLFADEHPLTDDGIDPGDHYRDAFLADRQPDADGRSLKDLQLRTRLFKYRCSYMIYSDSFDHLPATLKSHIYTRLHTILDGADTTGDYDHHSSSERRKIKSILLATKPGFAQAAATASR